MFQSFDKDRIAQPTTRPEWMALLARAPQHLLVQALPALASAPQWLRKPETGLMMVQGRAGGTGERFNLGEVTVTRCALRLTTSPSAKHTATPADSPAEANPHAKPQAPTAPVGVAYVLGRNHRHAQLAAVADALLQDPLQREGLEEKLLQPVRAHLQQLQAVRHARAQTTKVDFLTVAREAGGEDGQDNEAEEA